MVECAQVIRKANFKMSKQLIYSGKLKISIQLRMKILLFQLTRTRRLLSMVSRRSRLQVREC